MFFFLSWNAAHASLLAPDAHAHLIPELRSAHTAILTSGPMTRVCGRPGLEILFEDDSVKPLFVTIAIEQCDLDLSTLPLGGGHFLSVWTRSGKAMTLPAKYRIAPALPYLQPWVVH